MGIKTKSVTIWGIPETAYQRMCVLMPVLGTYSKGALLGMAIARLEGGFGCTHCGAWIGSAPVDPPDLDSKEWAELAEHHTDKCEWIKTKGHQIKK